MTGHRSVGRVWRACTPARLVTPRSRNEPPRSYPTTSRPTRPQEHFEFLGERAGVETAERFLQAAEATFHELAAMPEMGSPQHFLNPRFVDTRRWRVRGFENYLIFYRPRPHGIEILRVLYATRDIASLFE